MLSNPNIYKKLHTIKAIERSIATGDRLDRSQDNKFQQGDRSDDTIDRIQGSNARTLRSKSYKQDNRSNSIGVAIESIARASRVRPDRPIASTGTRQGYYKSVRTRVQEEIPITAVLLYNRGHGDRIHGIGTIVSTEDPLQALYKRYDENEEPTGRLNSTTAVGVNRHYCGSDFTRCTTTILILKEWLPNSNQYE